MEHVVYSNVMSHLERHDILTHQQFGFRQGYSAELQLLQTIHDLSLTNNKSQCDLILLDFSKAFDRVPHRHLILKLKHYGVRNSVLDWIQSFLSNRTQQVICGGCSSSSVNVVSEVAQGSVLGPCCFYFVSVIFPIMLLQHVIYMQMTVFCIQTNKLFC